MRVIGISCSPRQEGNTEVLINESLKNVENNGGEIEHYNLSDKNIKPCIHCLSCYKVEGCVLKDDLSIVLEKMLKVDALLIGTPVHFLSVSSQAKILIDRTFCFRSSYKLAGKFGAGIITASSMGHSSTWMLLNSYFGLQRIIPVDVVMGFAKKKGEVKYDKFAMLAAKELGIMLSEGKNNFSLFKRKVPLYQLIQQKYKIDSSPLSRCKT